MIQGGFIFWVFLIILVLLCLVLFYFLKREQHQTSKLANLLSEQNDTNLAMLNQLHEGVIATTADMTVWVNQKMTNMTGYQEEELKEKGFISIIHPDDQQIYRSRFERRLAGQKTSSVFPLRITCKNDNIRWLQLHSTLINIKGIKTIIDYCLDITSEKAAMESIKASEHQFLLFMNSIPGLIFIKDDKGELLFLNKYLRDNFGPENTAFYPANSINAGVNGNYVNATDQEALQKGISSFVAPIVDKFGATRDFEVLKFRLPLGKDEYQIGVIGFDITARKKSELIQKSLFEISEAVHTTADLDTFYKKCHEIIAKLYNAENFCVARVDRDSSHFHFPYIFDEKLEAIPPGMSLVASGKEMCLTQYLINYGEPILFSKKEYAKFSQDNNIHLFNTEAREFLGVPLKNSAHEVFGILMVYSYRDKSCFSEADKQSLGFISTQISLATHRKKTEDELRKREEHYRLLFQNIPVGVSHYSTDLRITEFNEMYLKISGLSSEIAQNLDLNKVKDKRLDKIYRDSLMGIEGTHEDWFQATYSDRFFYLSAKCVPFVGNDGEIEGGVSIIADITERKVAEEQIQRQLNHLAGLRIVDLAIASNMEIAEVLDILMQKTIEELEVDAANLVLRNLENDEIEGCYSQGIQRKELLGKCQISFPQRYPSISTETGLLHFTPENKLNGLEDFYIFMEDEGFLDCFSMPIIMKNEVQGILEVYRKTKGSDMPTQEWVDYLETMAGQAGIAIENSKLFDALDEANKELIHAYDSTIEGWAKTLELRDLETKGHCMRVADLTVQLAKKLHFSEEELIHIRRGALLHDIGKIGIPDSILLKPGALNDMEWDVMKRHTDYAEQFLLDIDFLKPALDIPSMHHEKWDGTGYPKGLKGEEIALSARIFSVIDVWDALTSDRPYRDAWSEEKTFEYINEYSGTQFDPRVVDSFFELIKEIQK
ncbi:MAG: PAS domain S-box protein [Anaerolineaceae bacterium]|nr:PAS domain S-box protein [Anaerolineaceae bacterium]